MEVNYDIHATAALSPAIIRKSSIYYRLECLDTQNRCRRDSEGKIPPKFGSRIHFVQTHLCELQLQTFS